MSYDDIIYLLLICGTILVGPLFRALSSTSKELFSSFLGVSIIIFVSGPHSAHPLIATLFTIILLKLCSKKYVHRISFFVLFSYLLFFRLCHYLNLPAPPPHTNAIQMILTLKLVGLCGEVHDSWRKKEKLKLSSTDSEKEQLELELKYESVNPTSIDVFHYAFAYIGVLTGPYFRYRTYYDMLHEEEGRPVNFLLETGKRLRFVPLYICFFLIFNHFFPLQFAESTEIFIHYSFLYRVFYMTPVFITFRMRIYIGFVLSECACIMAGLGCYPIISENCSGRGPANLKALDKFMSTKQSSDTSPKYDFQAIKNIDEWGAEFSPTVRSGMKSWNMTVQYWLVRNVYKRLILPKAAKEAITMLTSAFWHGVYSGYYLSMLTVPFILAVEDFYDKLIRRRLSDNGKRVYDFISWIHKMQQFSYMGMAFLLLKVDTIFFYWKSIGFIYHGLIIILHAIAQYVNLISYKVDKKLQKSRITAQVGDSRVTFVRPGSSEICPENVSDRPDDSKPDQVNKKVL